MNQHPDWQSAFAELESEIESKADSSALEELQINLSLAAEAIRSIRGVLEDIIEAAEIDPTEYKDDLDRIDQIGHLLM